MRHFLECKATATNLEHLKVNRVFSKETRMSQFYVQSA